MIAYFLSLCEVILTYISITVVLVFIPVLFDPRGQGLLFDLSPFFHSELLISVYSALLTYLASWSRNMKPDSISCLKYASSDSSTYSAPTIAPQALHRRQLAGVLGFEFLKVGAKIRRLASSSCGYLSAPLSVVVSPFRPPRSGLCIAI
mgnify:CR=1 FL=1